MSDYTIAHLDEIDELYDGRSRGRTPTPTGAATEPGVRELIGP